MRQIWRHFVQQKIVQSVVSRNQYPPWFEHTPLAGWEAGGIAALFALASFCGLLAQLHSLGFNCIDGFEYGTSLNHFSLPGSPPNNPVRNFACCNPLRDRRPDRFAGKRRTDINTPQFAPGKIMQEAIFNINVSASAPDASTIVSFGLFAAGLMLCAFRHKTVVPDVVMPSSSTGQGNRQKCRMGRVPSAPNWVTSSLI